MAIVTSRTFRSGNSEALRLPREVAYGPGVELVIEKSGDVMTIYPRRPSMTELIRRLNELPGPTSIATRDEIEPPERDGL